MKTLLLISLLIFTGQALGQEISKGYVHESIIKAAKSVGVEPSLLWSVCYSESNLKPTAYVHNDGLHGNSSFGICQVLYKTAVELGMKPSEDCERDFRTQEKLESLNIVIPGDFIELERNYKTCPLFGPYTNAYYAALYLKKQIDRYDGSWISGIAAYNTGSLKSCKTGKVYRAKDRKVIYTCQPGGLLNEKYVSRVLEGMKNYPFHGE